MLLKQTGFNSLFSYWYYWIIKGKKIFAVIILSYQCWFFVHVSIFKIFYKKSFFCYENQTLKPSILLFFVIWLLFKPNLNGKTLIKIAGLRIFFVFIIKIKDSKTLFFLLKKKKHIFPQNEVIYWNILSRWIETRATTLLTWCPQALGWYKVNVDGAVFAD